MSTKRTRIKSGKEVVEEGILVNVGFLRWKELYVNVVRTREKISKKERLE